MRSLPEPYPYRLSFLLPDGTDVDAFYVRTESDGCVVTFHAAGLMSVEGPSREAVLAFTAAVVRVALPYARDVAIAATMVTQCQEDRGIPSGRDSWTIIVGAQVAFCPTSVPHVFPPRPPPALAVLPGGRAP